MTRDFFQLRNYRIYLSMILLFGMIMTVTTKTFAQHPQLPILSLTGAKDGYNKDWYPDGRIQLPVSEGGSSAREFLVPVFIDNKWWHYKGNDVSGEIYVPDPIISFSFKLLFDSVAIMPVDVITEHPFPDDDDIRAETADGDYYEPLAQNFRIQWSDYQDSSYWRINHRETNDNPALSTMGRGRAIKIYGKASQSSLPVCDTMPNREDFRVLCYVKFRIMHERYKIKPEHMGTLLSQIEIGLDTIMYNDLNIRREAPFKEWREIYTPAGDDYPDPDPSTYYGVAGINNYGKPTDVYSLRPGSIYLNLSEALPRFGYQINNTNYKDPIWDYENQETYHPDFFVPEGMWHMRDILVVDSAGNDDNHKIARYRLTLRNSVPDTRLVDVIVSSDSPWLRPRGTCETSGIVNNDEEKNKVFINYIDRIMNPGDEDDDNQSLNYQKEVYLDLECYPDRIVDSPTEYGNEKCGIYEGFITLNSSVAEINPIRIRVVFINLRNPFEPGEGTYKPNRGIKLTIRNSRGQAGDTTRILFGTGHRATDNVDTLFGEYAYRETLPSDREEMHARFYHLNEDSAIARSEQFGFGCFAPNAGLEWGEPGYIESIDIRDINDTLESYRYLVRFDAGGADNYPVVISWDTTDFPTGADLFLSDTCGGNAFESIDMRKGTGLGQGPGKKFSHTIQDHDVHSFIIEYTVPKVIRYLDEYGNKKLKMGWNLVSMPLRPRDHAWDNVYPNAISTPWHFSKNGWQQSEILTPGVGYFVKYDQIIDDQFKGVKIKRLTPAYYGGSDGDPEEDAYSDKVRINRGWNTIGTLTDPVNIEAIDFEPFEGKESSSKPTQRFVRAHGVYGYVPGEGYKEVSVMERGQGYWIKADTVEGKLGGYLYIENQGLFRQNGFDNGKSDIIANSTEIIVSDNAMNANEVYVSNTSNDISNFELPPLPPSELFDVRFSNNCYVVNEKESIVLVQGVEYPLTLTIKDADAAYTFVDALTDEVFGTIDANTTASVEIKNTANNAIKIQKSNAYEGDFAISNYPNPAKENTFVNFKVANNSNVNISLFDIMGNKVLTVVNTNMNAGEYTEEINVSNLAAGKYICKFTAGNHVRTIGITVVK